MNDEPQANIDKQGRVCDKQGHPLRNRRLRTFGTAPFMGRGGNPPVNAQLETRIKDYARQHDNEARKKPGSQKK